ncbi:hypothetical protein KQX54_015546 [Cotesia glomerata]|uniref:Uncharacterized protein n=1 Tax=Cotesia glomerata TaxID=32391 RepID=A0AAV7IZJ4_COTGL|nr:hypothetical protein KQX54_015546 [Cotesia glomerata]
MLCAVGQLKSCAAQSRRPLVDSNPAPTIGYQLSASSRAERLYSANARQMFLVLRDKRTNENEEDDKEEKEDEAFNEPLGKMKGSVGWFLGQQRCRPTK